MSSEQSINKSIKHLQHTLEEDHILEEDYTPSKSSGRIDINTLLIVRAGDHLSFKISKQILPTLLIFG